MSRIDWVVLRRLTAGAVVAVIVIFSVFLLLDSLDYAKFVYLTGVGGMPLALLSLLVSATRWTVRALPVTLLIGAILGIVDLQVRQEFNVIRASGASIWRVLRAPLIAAGLFGVVVCLFVDTAATQFDRSINPTQSADSGSVTSDGALWLDQQGDAGRYVMRAAHVQPSGDVLYDVTIFLQDDPEMTRVVTGEAVLKAGAWHVASGTGYRAGRAPQPLDNLVLPTDSGPGDVQLRLASTADLTVFEVVAVFLTRINDPILRSAVITRLLRLLTMPLTMMGSVVMAFAFTSGYRKTNKYGRVVLYGIVLGFVVFFVTEMADRAGSAGALNPAFAAVGPAFLGIVTGLTVLLYREDGRA